MHTPSWGALGTKSAFTSARRAPPGSHLSSGANTATLNETCVRVRGLTVHETRRRRFLDRPLGHFDALTIVRNDTPLFTSPVTAGNPADYHETVALEENDVIDFGVDYGTNTNNFYDNTGIAAIITAN